MTWKEWFDEVPYPEDEGEPQGYTRRKTITLWTIAILLWGAAWLLHVANAEAQVNCRLVTVAYPAMQLSMVSKECWEVPDLVAFKAPVPRAKPLIQVAEVKVKKVVKRSGCRKVWRTLKNGHRKYRCRK